MHNIQVADVRRPQAGRRQARRPASQPPAGLADWARADAKRSVGRLATLSGVGLSAGLPGLCQAGTAWQAGQLAGRLAGPGMAWAAWQALAGWLDKPDSLDFPETQYFIENCFFTKNRAGTFDFVRQAPHEIDRGRRNMISEKNSVFLYKLFPQCRNCLFYQRFFIVFRCIFIFPEKYIKIKWKWNARDLPIRSTGCRTNWTGADEFFPFFTIS